MTSFLNLKMHMTIAAKLAAYAMLGTAVGSELESATVSLPTVCAVGAVVFTVGWRISKGFTGIMKELEISKAERAKIASDLIIANKKSSELDVKMALIIKTMRKLRCHPLTGGKCEADDETTTV